MVVFLLPRQGCNAQVRRTEGRRKASTAAAKRQARSRKRGWRAKRAKPPLDSHSHRRTKEGEERGRWKNDGRGRRRVCLICQNGAVRKREIANDNDIQVYRDELYKFSRVVRETIDQIGPIDEVSRKGDKWKILF